MPDKASAEHISEIADEGTIVTLDELCSCCGVEVQWITELIQYGVIERLGDSKSEWRFTSLAVVRVAKAKRLERDLDLNIPGIALALELLDEIEDLRSRLKTIEK